MKTKRTQKSISLIVVLATILSCFTFLALPVSAANNSDYNVNNAIEYATKHWDDGKGLCAEFVSDCLRAGGFTSVYEVNAKRLGEKLQQYGTKINCHTWSSKSYLTANSFDMPLSKGDVIIWVNRNGSSSSGHAMLYSGETDSKGRILIYAHNKAQNKKAIKPSSDAVEVYAIHINNSRSLENLLFDYRLYGAPDLHPDLYMAFGYNETKLKAHWIEYGQSEGRIASILFDAKWYLQQNPDVANMWGKTNYKAAYNHFVEHGFWEGRQGSPYFSAKYYLEKHPDLKAAFGNNYLLAAKHFLEYGVSSNELRQASSQFSLKKYSQYNTDVKKAFSKPMDRIYHYIKYVQYGREKWRRCL